MRRRHIAGALSLICLLRKVRPVSPLPSGASSLPRAESGSFLPGFEPSFGSDSFRLLFERSTDAYFLLVGNGIPCCNRACLDLLGVNEREAIAWSPLLKPINDIGTDTAPEGESVTEVALRNGTHRYETLYHRPDNVVLRVEVLLTVVTMDEKPVLHGTVRDVTERQRRVDALRDTARGVSATTGDAFFRSLVEYLSRALDADFAFVGELEGETDRRVRTTAVCVDGQIAPNFEYDLLDTPCANVVESGICSYPTGVQGMFPRDLLLVDMGVDGYVGTPLFDTQGHVIGLMVVLSRSPLRDLPVAEAMLQVFASRAASELERRRAEAARERALAALTESEQRLRLANDQLEERVRERTAELERERALLETILRQMPAGVMVAEATTGKLLLGNEQLTRILRGLTDKLDGLQDLNRLTMRRPDGSVYDWEEMPIARALHTGEVVHDEEATVLRGDGSRGVLLISAAPIHSEAGDIIAAVGSGLDITYLKQTEEALRRLHDELEMQVQERTAELAQANRALQTEVQERRRAEQVSRGQTAALSRTLTALTAQPDLDTFLGHLFHAIREQLGADGVGVNLYDAVLDQVVPRFAAIGDHTLSEEDFRQFGVAPGMAAQDEKTWQATVIERQPFAIYDIPGDKRMVYREAFMKVGVQAALVVPLMLNERPAGYCVVFHTHAHQYEPEEIELAQALAQQAILALQLTGLAELGQEAAVLKERNRIAREIHDTLAQGFAGIIVQLKLAETALTRKPEKALPAIHQARALAQDSLSEARRSVWALRPNALEGGTLPEAFRKLVEEMTNGTALQAKFEVTGTHRPLPGETESNLLRIGQESLNNTIKYAQATEARVTLNYEAHQVCLSVADNGVGFVPGDRPRGSGFGHVGMRERMRALHGVLSIRSSPGQGTEIIATVPLGAEENMA